MILIIKKFHGRTISNILDDSNRMFLEKEKKILERENIKIITIKDNEYPKRLLNMQNPPFQLYVKGDIKKLYDDNIAIIGSRNASEYGKKVSRKIAKDFSSLGINVVSGLAIGIDKFAHLGALDLRGGRTIAVLGNGLCKDLFYPKENLKVYERILEEGGGIVSEYSFFEGPKAYHFPERNRIISGLADKLLVVEASVKSGTLITVDFAIEQGKDVYAVPGNIDKYNSRGTNKLIQEGAIPFLSIEDIIN